MMRRLPDVLVAGLILLAVGIGLYFAIKDFLASDLRFPVFTNH
jgi:hypothetical protein